jgi:mannose-6-phosphate isomerase
VRVSFEILPRHFVEKPWGQANLPAHFGGRSEQVGEIWFDRTDAPLPLLCKWLFTSEKLSVQVHPNDDQARVRGLPSGKEECWIVTEVEKDTCLGIGLTRSHSPEELREASLSGEIEDLLDWKPVRAGDWFYIPAGTVHAIGAGVQLVEIQQNADVTYRLYDYGRPRELHLDDGIAVSGCGPYRGPCGHAPGAEGLHLLVAAKYFRLHLAVGARSLDEVAAGECYLVPISGKFDSPSGLLEAGMVAYGEARALHALDENATLLIAREA